MIKLFATDLDGTLLKPENHIKEHDKKALHTLSNHGIDFAIATGRMDRDILEICKEIGLSAHRISQNGAFVDVKSNQKIYSKTFDAITSAAIHKTVQDYPTIFCITTADEIYISEKNEEIRAIEALQYFPLIEGVDFIDEYGDTVHPSKFMLLGEGEQLFSLQRELNNHFAEQIESYISDERCMDIVPKHVSKGNGLKKLAKQLNIETSEIAVIGDSYNDIPMFEMTPYSFAMATAPEPVKAKATYVVEDVYEAIEQLTITIKSS
ncbi:HAD family hydrolase [Gracilibacillus sp. YIM 98692]|uniref:HAD family hydrolase n=1 Tax=Gracilibacillus sp. YIM 98692 TaxID=2663532 RepID=UPI0013CFB986|nr:HAD family hydrolase [Gracilibacillus sp. YIM 98692]